MSDCIWVRFLYWVDCGAETEPAFRFCYCRCPISTNERVRIGDGTEQHSTSSSPGPGLKNTNAVCRVAAPLLNVGRFRKGYHPGLRAQQVLHLLHLSRDDGDDLDPACRFVTSFLFRHRHRSSAAYFDSITHSLTWPSIRSQTCAHCDRSTPSP